MKIDDLRAKFLEYYESCGYKKGDSSPVIPVGDPSVLFTTAGMQQFKPYYIDPSDAPSDQMTTVQRVIRTSDIGEVGDDTHLTSFEMLGNFIFGQKDIVALKTRAIKEAWKFVYQVLDVKPDRIYVTVFEGDDKVPADEASIKIWRSLGLTDDKIRRAPREDNFWGPTGDNGPCGPTSEIYIDGVEVWNLVFNEYYQDKDGKLEKLDSVGLDTGSGLERLATTTEGAKSIWDIEPYCKWILPDDTYNNRSITHKVKRILADHIKASSILLNEDVVPGKNGREAIVRRLLRKVIFLADTYAIQAQVGGFYHAVCQYYQLDYDKVFGIYKQEAQMFQKIVERASRELDRWFEGKQGQLSDEEIVNQSFLLYQSHGFPMELSLEYVMTKGLSLDIEKFQKLFVGHQEVSRQGSEKTFKSGLADDSQQTIKHHTVHHLLLAALRQVLGDHVYQKGSNVTAERLRLDFSHGEKMTDDQKSQAEKLVNDWIERKLPITKREMPKEEALKTGALAEFGQKYGEVVNVYEVGEGDQIISRELCGGPHVANTSELGHFKILKEEASSQGVRRIKAKCE